MTASIGRARAASTDLEFAVRGVDGLRSEAGGIEGESWARVGRPQQGSSARAIAWFGRGPRVRTALPP